MDAKSITSLQLSLPMVLPWGDTLRFVACTAVVFQHIAHGVALSPDKHSVETWWLAQTIVVLTKWAVPAFVMLSGALMLDPARNETPAEFLNKRWKRLGWPILFWSFFYLLFSLAKRRFVADPSDIALSLVVGGTYYHMYFLFVVCGLYLITPALRIWHRGASRAQRLMVVGLSLTLAAVEQMRSAAVDTASPTIVTLFIPYIGYYLAGYELRSIKLSKRGVGLTITAYVLLVVATTVSTGVMVGWAEGAAWGWYPVWYFSPTVILMSISVIMLLTQFGGWSSPALAQVVNRAAAASLGIYLVHPAVIEILGRLGLRIGVSSTYFMLPVMTILVFGVSWLITELATLNQWGRKIMR